MRPKTYEEVAQRAGLSPEIAQVYVTYMRRRWPSSEKGKCKDGYAEEWADRFKQSRAYQMSDLEGQAVLEDLGYQDNPGKFDRCLEHVRGQGGEYNEYAVCNATLRSPGAVMARTRRRRSIKKNWPAFDHLAHAVQEERLARGMREAGDERWRFHAGKAAAHREAAGNRRSPDGLFTEGNPPARGDIRRVREPRFPQDLGRQYFYKCQRPDGREIVEAVTAPLMPGTAAYDRAKRLYKHVIGPFKSRYEALKWWT